MLATEPAQFERPRLTAVLDLYRRRLDRFGAQRVAQ
jgi:hypothetical protein